ncbi:class III signal peptide-containing protein [Thermococcus sp. LS1]|uniref:class III signal peptide-containing protein n=1 Tax=unclassified Thermococcus TaxID=2627626 RepID=UPI001431E5AE|nr:MULTISPECIES: class III signal peptide-containing protein [unclassified Thermococcus]NJD99691.1 class III signal peptide-containing protein [Thermococcus sp. LS1]NJE41624.1 class III signal peptide-containing protein [Thermococcus sp. GR6]
MMRKAQSAIEYLFMLAAVLVLVVMAARIVLNGTKNLNEAISNYTTQVRKQILEDL